MTKHIRFIFCVAFGSLLISCSFQETVETFPTEVVLITSSVPCPDTMPLDPSTPAFLRWKYPSGYISNSEYEASLLELIPGGVQIKVSADGIDQSVLESTDSEYRSNTLWSRIALFLDGILIPDRVSSINGLIAGTDGLMESGPFHFGWRIKLPTGFHQARAVFNIDTGETVEYEWSFCITP